MEITVREITNIRRLIEGYQYAYLPEGLILGSNVSKIREFIIEILRGNHDGLFPHNNNLISVKSSKIGESPSSIYNFGSEPISIFDLKNNGSLREIQVPNLYFYIIFICNSIISCTDVFDKIYNKENMDSDCSNSYIMFEKMFLIRNYSDDDPTKVIAGEFASRNNKTINQLISKNRTLNYFKKMNSKLYVLKLDVQSFYPNVYTHYLSKLKEKEPFVSKIMRKDYFEFLDNYNMKINSNQTKGILSGCFSSNISSELLMLSIDYEIKKYINGKGVEYIRYVDDLTFFSDSLESLQLTKIFIQQLLSRSKLIINQNKTVITENILDSNSINFNEINHDYKLLGNFWIDYNQLNQLKSIIRKNLELGYIGEVKVLLYRIKENINGSEIQKKENDEFESDFSLEKEEDIIMTSINDMDPKLENITNPHICTVNYLLQLIFLKPVLAVHCYRIIDTLLDYYGDNDNMQIINCLEEKNDKINELFLDSIVQTWHYYVLNKFNRKMSKIYFNKLIESCKRNGVAINPILIITFIEKGDNKNRDIIKYIIQEYCMNCGYEGKEWMSSIMLSKWSTTLFNIRSVDKFNYYNFFTNNYYKTFWENITK